MYTFTIETPLARDIFPKGIIGEMEYDEPAPTVEEIIKEYIEYVFSLDKENEDNQTLQELVSMVMNTGRSFDVKLKL